MGVNKKSCTCNKTKRFPAVSREPLFLMVLTGSELQTHILSHILTVLSKVLSQVLENLLHGKITPF